MDFLQVGRQFREAQTDYGGLEPESVLIMVLRGGFCTEHSVKPLHLLQEQALAHQELLRKAMLWQARSYTSSLPSPRLFQLQHGVGYIYCARAANKTQSSA